MPINIANTGAFTSPTQNVVGVDGLVHASQVLRDGYVQQIAAQQGAPHQADDIRHNREQGQRDHEPEQPRQYERLEGVHTDRIQRIDFFVELHRAQLGRKGAPGAARNNDRGEQNAHLAQHADGDEIDDEYFGAEPAQLLGAHVGDDDADEESDQRRDGHGRDARIVDMPGDGDRPQTLQAGGSPANRREDPAEKRQRGHQVAPLPHGVETRFRPGPARSGVRCRCSCSRTGGTGHSPFNVESTSRS